VFRGVIPDVQIRTSYVNAFEIYRLTDIHRLHTYMHDGIIYHAASRVVKYVVLQCHNNHRRHMKPPVIHCSAKSLAYFDERAAAGQRLGVVSFEQRAVIIVRFLRKIHTSKTPTDSLSVCGLADNRRPITMLVAVLTGL